MSENQNKLSSAEISQLWANYMNDSMSCCMLKYFKETAEDIEIKSLLHHALELSESHIKELTSIFEKQNFPIPSGFSEADVNVNAPPLFTDIYYLNFLHFWGSVGLESYGLSLYLAANSVVSEYFTERIKEAMDLVNQAKNLMLTKGIFIRSPYITLPTKVEFVHDRQFLAGWFGEQRPLTTLEIATLSVNKQRNEMVLATLLAFSQVTEDEDIKNIMLRGKNLCEKNIKRYEDVLRESHLPSAEIWDTLVTDSNLSPFSDKLCLFHLSTILNRGIGFYGTTLGVSSRRDLGAMYMKIMSALLLYAEDTAELMIEKGYMEQPPTAVKRDETNK